MPERSRRCNLGSVQRFSIVVWDGSVNHKQSSFNLDVLCRIANGQHFFDPGRKQPGQSERTFHPFRSKKRKSGIQEKGQTLDTSLTGLAP